MPRALVSLCLRLAVMSRVNLFSSLMMVKLPFEMLGFLH